MSVYLYFLILLIGSIQGTYRVPNPSENGFSMRQKFKKNMKYNKKYRQMVLQTAIQVFDEPIRVQLRLGRGRVRKTLD